MRTLDNDMIIDLQRAAMQVEEEQETKTLGQCYLFAIKPEWREGIVLVGNRHFLIEWPLELVDVTAPMYRKILRAANLLRTQSSDKEEDILTGLKTSPWDTRDEMKLRDTTKIFECEEVEPEHDMFTYRTSAGQVYYFNKYYRALIDKVWPAVEIGGDLVTPVSTKIYVNFGTERAALVLYENGRKRGALANSIPTKR